MGGQSRQRSDNEARLPRIVEGLRLHLGFALALIAAVIVWVIQTRTPARLRNAGGRPERPRRALRGLRSTGVILKTALLSGGLAALAGWSESRGSRGN